MDSLLGYRNLIQIHVGDNSKVYLAQRSHSYHEQTQNSSVILKVLNADYPSPEQLRRYKQEYDLTSKTKLPSLIEAFGLEEWQRTLVIILEDIGGVALKHRLKKSTRLQLTEFFPIAIKIAEGIGQLHSQAIIHKDINPSNIIFNSKTKVLKLIDLGISTQFCRENPLLKTPDSIEGTLPYISPEQTGRMNRVLDYRTDLYSLGVTFYELLTGTLPFTSQDPMELVHCHIAKPPIPPNLVVTDIPKILSDVVLKLMAKNAEDRYQSAWGLKADLQECWTQWQENQAIALFPLTKNDISDRFQIPQKLYGREQEINMLLSAFERVAQADLHTETTQTNTELILVAGYSGIGKSALVQELYKPITAMRSYFIGGKFDQYQRNIPYSALASAFGGLVKQLLGESPSIVQQWRAKILEALGTNGQVVIDVIPDLELIIGRQPPVTELGAGEAQNRFNLVFQRFMQVLCRPNHPLVMYLDDMQWADIPTLNWLGRLLGEGQIKHLLIILAFRDNEVSDDHPLALAIAQLQRQGVNLRQITLSNLPLEQIEQLIAETLNRDLGAVKDLAELVHYKTQGNPFFTSQFLKNLHLENLVGFNYDLKQWEWNLAQIEQMSFTHNVVELMVSQLQKLPQSVQEVLSIAAYLGTNFDLKTLSWVINRTQIDIFTDLRLAIDRGFMVARSPLDQNLLIQDYKFGHDRIQQAAYTLISAQEGTHYKIGKLLWQQLDPEKLAEQIFAVVNHLNHGLDLISDQRERDELAQLNLIACRKAKDATAYQTATEYAEIGLKFLGDGAWERQYAIALNLHELATEVTSLNGKFDRMEQWFNAVIAHTQTLLAQIRVYDVKIRALTSQSQPQAAIATGRAILKDLGVEFPDRPSPQDIQQAAQEIDDLSKDYIEDLFDLPPMTDANNLGKIQILASIYAPCYQIASPYFPLVVALQVHLSIQYGNSPTSAFSYACYAFLLCNLLQDVNTGSNYSQLAYRLAAANKNIRCHTFFAICYYLTHRYAHLREAQPIAQKAYEVGLETGNLEYAGYSIYTFFASLFWCGQPLGELEPQLLAYRQQTLNLNQSHSANMFNLLWESAIFLNGNPQQIELSFNQPPMITENLVLGFSSCQLGAMVHYLSGDMARAIAYTNQAKAYLAGGAGTISEAEFYFYDSLILANNLNPEVRERIQSNQAKLMEWAASAPMNFLHKWQLVAAMSRVGGNKLEAIELYDQAIVGAKAQGYPQEEALAMELAADFYLNWGKDKIAQSYLQEAHYCYLLWGARIKVGYLEAQYPQLFLPASKSPSRSNFRTSGNNTSAELDLASVIKSSQAIASEIILENLLQTLMKILLENAGAQIGYLLLSNSNTSDLINLSIAIHIDADRITIHPQQPIDQVLPESILHYVLQTHESVVLDNANESGNFIHDPYLQLVKTKSILCYPLVNQGNLVGLVYLENQVSIAAFTKNRIEILQLLGGQAAIAITNAQLYAEKVNYSHTLEQKVAERTAELIHANEELSKLVNLDGLTKIANRRWFDTYLETEWKRQIRDQKPLALILIDIDYFKLYNDQYGHQVGDECLIQVAQTIAQVPQRPTDLVARYGGEEFVVVLPNTNLEGGMIVAEAMRQAVISLAIPHAKSEVNQYVTLSMGVSSSIQIADISPDNLIAQADAALYIAKRQGRNRAIAQNCC